MLCFYVGQSTFGWPLIYDLLNLGYPIPTVFRVAYSSDRRCPIVTKGTRFSNQYVICVYVIVTCLFHACQDDNAANTESCSDHAKPRRISEVHHGNKVTGGARGGRGGGGGGGGGGSCRLGRHRCGLGAIQCFVWVGGTHMAIVTPASIWTCPPVPGEAGWTEPRLAPGWCGSTLKWSLCGGLGGGGGSK